MQLKLAKKKEINEDVLRMIIQYGLGFASRVKNLENKEIEDWKEDKLYEKGAKVLYNNYLWIAKVTNQSSTWNESYWQLIGDNLSLITKQDIEAMINLSDEDVKTLQSLILDTSIELSHVWSSSKTYGEIQNAIKKGEAFTLSKLASTMTASFEVATSISDIKEGNILYLLNTGTNTYDIYALISGTPTKIASTTIDLSQFYTKTEIDNDFVKKTDADGKYATITTVDGKVDKTSILSTISSTPSDDKLLSEKAINDTLVKKTDIVDNLTSTDTDKPLSANQGKVLKDEMDSKANENDVIKKTDITTKIDSTSTNTEIATAKAVNDLLQTESPGNLRIPLNEDLNNLIYNRTRVWMNSQTVEIATFTNMPSGRFTECAVIFIPYENANSDYGEQIFVGNNNRIFIRNKVTTTWTAWQKICTTSSVADVGKTDITSKVLNATVNSGGSVYYSIKNGICYIQIHSVVTTADSNSKNILPNGSVPILDTNLSDGHYIVSSTNSTNGLLVINSSGGAKYYGNAMNIYATISYPVKES